ncbi:MAG: hypothetical protein H7315_14365 [Herminiimonas sp.]|nr:hypothetical protein [Herminiimonas sp.]
MKREFRQSWWTSPSRESDLLLQRIAEDAITKELAWLEQDIDEGFGGYHRSVWWRQRVQQPWLSDLGFKGLVGNWLFGYARSGDSFLYENWWLSPSLEAIEMRSQYRNIYDPMFMALSVTENSPWLYFDPVIDDYAKKLSFANQENEQRSISLWQRKLFLEMEKPWRTKLVSGFPPAPNYQGDDALPQFCAVDVMYTKTDFYLELLHALAPNWQHASMLSSKYLITFTRYLNQEFQWAILLERSKSMLPAVRQFDLVVIPTSIKKTIKPRDILFHYHFPFGQNNCVATQELALWQADVEFKYRHLEMRMRYLEPFVLELLECGVAGHS